MEPFMTALASLSKRNITLSYHDAGLKRYADLADLINQVSPPVKVFKDDKRTFVAEIKLQGLNAILKIEHNHTRDFWNRAATLIQPANVERLAMGRDTLIKLNLNAPKPLIIGVERRFGMVNQSFIIYEKVEGTKSKTLADLAKTCAALTSIHDAGYIRDDVHLDNFLIEPNGTVCIIDYKLRKPWVFPSGQMALEKDRLIREAPETAQFFDQSYQKNFGYRCMKGHRVLLKFSKRVFK